MDAVKITRKVNDMAFPHDILIGCDSALAMFCAAFGGFNDVQWIADEGLYATCVDLDEGKLDVMRQVYPDTWDYECADAFDFARKADRKWDVVTADPWTQDMDKVAAEVALWCSVASRAVILGTGVNTSVAAPDGWEITSVRWRTDYDGGVFWTVMERA